MKRENHVSSLEDARIDASILRRAARILAAGEQQRQCRPSPARHRKHVDSVPSVNRPAGKQPDLRGGHEAGKKWYQKRRCRYSVLAYQKSYRWSGGGCSGAGQCEESGASLRRLRHAVRVTVTSLGGCDAETLRTVTADVDPTERWDPS